MIEYSDNCSDTFGNLWQFKRDEGPANNADFCINNSQSFKYKATLLDNGNSFVKKTKVVVPLKYLSNFWRCH